MSDTKQSKPLSLTELKSVPAAIRSQIVMTKDINLKSQAVIRSLVKNYESIEYAFRNLFRNSHVKIKDSRNKPASAEIQSKYNEGAQKNRDEVLNQLGNITQYFQQALDIYQETIESNHIKLCTEYTKPQLVTLQIEVPEMNRIISLFEIGDLVHLYSDNLYLNDLISLDDKNELTTTFANKIKFLAKNSSIKANASQKLATSLKIELG